MRRNGCPKVCFWRVRFFSAPFRFTLETPENLEGAEEKRTLQQHTLGQPFLRTTPSPLLGRAPNPEGPRIEKFQSRDEILKISSFQYGMKFSIENGFCIPSPSLTAEKQGPGLKFSSENENFKPRMKISSENEKFRAWGNDLFMCSPENVFFFSRSPGPLGNNFGADSRLQLFRNTLSTAGNSMTSSERPSPEPLLKKRGVPSRTAGEIILEMLWKPQMPLIIGPGGSQPYSRQEFQETL